MEKQDIINYVLTTPENTNPAILGGMLEQLIAESGEGGGGEGGVVEAVVTLTEDSTGTLGVTDTIKKSSELISQEIAGYAIDPSLVTFTKAAPTTIYTLSDGLSYSVGGGVSVIEGDATISEIEVEDITLHVLTIKGSCTLKVLGE